MHAAVDQIDHRSRVAGEFRTVLGIEKLPIGRIEIRRENISVSGIRRRLRRFDRDVGGLGNLVVDLLADRLELLGRTQAFRH